MVLQTDVQKKMMENKKKKTILTGVVVVADVNRDNNKEELVIDIEGVRGIIPKEEIDKSFNFKSLITFVGSQVKVIVKDVPKNADHVVCSRAMAQEIIEPQIIAKLEDGEYFDGRIINILSYGAYVDIDGVVGLMKNPDFADDYTAVGEKHKVGDTVQVKLKGRSATSKILFEAVTKFVSPNVVSVESLEAGQVVLGVVRNIQPWGVFVNIAPNVDALVDSDFSEIYEDQKVSVRIKSIRQGEDKLKVRGKIISLL